MPEHTWRPNVPLTESLTILSVFVVAFFVGIAIGILAWPALGRTLLASGLAARIPVALLMLVAMLGNWGTHYDARPSYPPQKNEHARVVGHARAGAAALVLDLVHDRVGCAVRNRRSGDRAAAGDGSRLDSRTRRARGDVASGRSAIGVLVERSSKYVVLLHPPHGRSAKDVRAALTRQISKLPAELRPER